MDATTQVARSQEISTKVAQLYQQRAEIAARLNRFERTDELMRRKAS